MFGPLLAVMEADDFDDAGRATAGGTRELLTQYGDIGVVWFDGDWISD